MRRRWRTAAAKQRLRQSDRLELAQLPEIHRRSQGEPGGGVGCWHRAGSAPAIAAIGSAAVAGAVACWDLVTRRAVTWAKPLGVTGSTAFGCAWSAMQARCRRRVPGVCGSYPCVCACRHGLPVLTEKREGVCRPRTRAGMRAGNLRGPTLPLSCRFTKSERNVRIGRRSDGFGRSEAAAERPGAADVARFRPPGLGGTSGASITATGRATAARCRPRASRSQPACTHPHCLV